MTPNDSLAALQTVIERRVNAFGVGEPVVQTQQGGALGGGEHRLIIELPGVTDVDKAVKMIGATPLLEFKLVKPGFEASTTDAQACGVEKSSAYLFQNLTSPAAAPDWRYSFMALATNVAEAADASPETLRKSLTVVVANLSHQRASFLITQRR